jgi:hypothetical protein
MKKFILHFLLLAHFLTSNLYAVQATSEQKIARQQVDKLFKDIAKVPIKMNERSVFEQVIHTLIVLTTLDKLAGIAYTAHEMKKPLHISLPLIYKHNWFSISLTSVIILSALKQRSYPAFYTNYTRFLTNEIDQKYLAAALAYKDNPEKLHKELKMLVTPSYLPHSFKVSFKLGMAQSFLTQLIDLLEPLKDKDIRSKRIKLLLPQLKTTLAAVTFALKFIKADPRWAIQKENQPSTDCIPL